MSKLTPKEKAESLLKTMSEQTYKFQEYAGANYSTDEVGYEAGKKCALIAVDEFIITLKKIMPDYKEDSWHPACWWEEVKQELLKLTHF